MTAKLGGESAGEAATAHIPDGRYSHFEASTSPYVDRSHELMGGSVALIVDQHHLVRNLRVEGWGLRVDVLGFGD